MHASYLECVHIFPHLHKLWRRADSLSHGIIKHPLFAEKTYCIFFSHTLMSGAWPFTLRKGIVYPQNICYNLPTPMSFSEWLSFSVEAKDEAFKKMLLTNQFWFSSTFNVWTQNSVIQWVWLSTFFENIIYWIFIMFKKFLDISSAGFEIQLIYSQREGTRKNKGQFEAFCERISLQNNSVFIVAQRQFWKKGSFEFGTFEGSAG